ncbi:hypothetical protein [Staphylococcus nepalensis]|jgi:hypothetical protein|uniref:Transposase n=1 Tax=Staphylococcus nepalensis TaxID=214473 RepID=A0A380GPK1_9STAP|nr:hypothetical protein [Staphylococcus nepalensis]GGB92867.1 hypothetical protein GCM10007203_24960 [Staphylococcus nepalensis]SUM55525.1 Transposase [Staphylococcus nepalensis]VDG67499.1 Uncharacterised protein [Lacrimispora indolis]
MKTGLKTNKVKRKFSFILVALDMRKIRAQRDAKLHKNKENVNFYMISIEIDVCF